MRVSERETNSATKLRREKKVVRFSVVHLCSFVPFVSKIKNCFCFGFHSSSFQILLFRGCLLAKRESGLQLSEYIIPQFDRNLKCFESAFIVRKRPHPLRRVVKSAVFWHLLKLKKLRFLYNPHSGESGYKRQVIVVAENNQVTVPVNRTTDRSRNKTQFEIITFTIPRYHSGTLEEKKIIKVSLIFVCCGRGRTSYSSESSVRFLIFRFWFDSSIAWPTRTVCDAKIQYLGVVFAAQQREFRQYVLSPETNLSTIGDHQFGLKHKLRMK